MSEANEAAEAANDGEQSETTEEAVAEAEAEAEAEYADEVARFIEPHEGMGTYNAAKTAFARMLCDSIAQEVDDWPFAPEDIQWSEGTPHTITDGEKVGLAADSIDRSRRPIWVVQVYNQLLRAASVDTDGGAVEVTTETVDGDRFQRLYEAHQDTFLDDANHLSVNNLNEGLRMRGFHPESFLAPEPQADVEEMGPAEDIYVTPGGTELEADEVDRVNFDPVTGDDLSEVDIKTQAELAELEDPTEYLGTDAEYEVPEQPEEVDGPEVQETDIPASEAEEVDEMSDDIEEESEESESNEAEDPIEALQTVSGIGPATAEDLVDAGFESVEDVEEAEPSELRDAGLNAGQVGNIKQAL